MIKMMHVCVLDCVLRMVIGCRVSVSESVKVLIHLIQRFVIRTVELCQ